MSLLHWYSVRCAYLQKTFWVFSSSALQHARFVVALLLLLLLHGKMPRHKLATPQTSHGTSKTEQVPSSEWLPPLYHNLVRYVTIHRTIRRALYNKPQPVHNAV